VSVATAWGSTAAERARHYPVDVVLPRAQRELFRAVTIEAPRRVVFRWLCQLRVAPYSYDWIDNFGRVSPRQLTPGLERLSPGQRFMTIFELLSFEKDRQITLGAAKRRTSPMFSGVAITYWLEDDGASRCRLIAKLGVRGYNAFFFWFLAWADLVMMRKQLITIKRLSEA
jgi:hypothetical protein